MSKKFNVGDLVRLNIKAQQLVIGELYRVEDVFSGYIKLAGKALRYSTHKFERAYTIEDDQNEFEKIHDAQWIYAKVIRGEA